MMTQDDETFSPQFIAWLTEVAFSEDTDLSQLDREELGDLWTKVDAMLAIVRGVEKKVRAELALILDTPLALPDGRVLKRKADARRTGWNNLGLLDRLIERATVFAIDPASGEQRALVDPKAMRGLIEPTHAVTKLRAVGVDHALYCTEEWTDTIEVIK